jgi:mannose-1-phosphate guanylyltransferase / mannose-6-phosphate isomerase
VMEHTDAGAVVPVDIGWHDVGSWAALWEIGDKDAQGNVRVGDVVAAGVKNAYLRSDGPMLVAVGLEDVFVVATGDAVLAISRRAVGKLKSVVEDLREGGRAEHSTHPRVHRPWGWYETLDTGTGYQVKHLMVGPGQGISLQAHKYRAEHWVVVSGTARVTRGDEVITLKESESTYLPTGIRHRLENTTGEPLSVIEVQSGNYLGEDDIVRFEDRYGRD